MQLNESQKQYAQLITETLGVTDNVKLNWMAQYAQIHAIYEGIEGGGQPQGQGYNAINATPFNTIGAANPALPGGHPNAPYDPVNGGYFHSAEYQKGSGDIPMSTLSTALEIAAVTIGFDLVPVVPAAGPMAFLTFNDYPYAGGKMGLANETALDGKGAGPDNKPIYISIHVDDLANMADIASHLTQMSSYNILTPKADGTADYYTFKGLFMDTSRIDGSLIFQVQEVKNGGSADVSIAEAFRYSKLNAVKVNGYVLNEATAEYWTVNGVDYDTQPTLVQGTTYWEVQVGGETVYTTNVGKTEPEPTNVITHTDATYMAVTPDLVKGVTDHIQSFSNFFGNGAGQPSNDPMSRAENETGTGNIIGARMFSKLIRMGAYEAVGQVTRQQLQDYPLYGIDVLGGVIETCQNEISQALNNRILDRLFKLGVENYKIQKGFQGVDLNLYISGQAGADPTKLLSDFSKGYPYKKFVDLNGQQVPDVAIKNALQGTWENVITNQRRVMSRMLAASNLVSSVTRRGRCQWCVTNAQVLTFLQDCKGFQDAPMVNDLVQGGEESLYFAGTLAGMKIYVDPYMRWNDTRILVGRKATVNNNRVQGSGVVFMPYILADQVQIIAEGTMAPKVLINSRFAVVDAGWYPEQNYYCFMVDTDETNLL